MKPLFKFIIRTSSFIGKEISEIFRQTRLLLVLVLGPFLIILLFGIGYKNDPRTLRTLFVVQEDNPYRAQIKEFAETMGDLLIYRGMVTDVSQALNRLSRGDLDVVVVIPEEVEEKIQNNEQASFTLYHNEIDPNQANYIEYFGKAYTDELNRRLLQNAAAEGQDEASTYRQEISQARQDVKSMRLALEAGQGLAAQESKDRLDEDLDDLTLLVGGSLGLMQSVEQTMGSGEQVNSHQNEAAIRDTLEQLARSRSELASLETAQGSVDRQIENLTQMEQQLDKLETQLTDFQRISPFVLVAPFTSQASSLDGFTLTPIGFFAPAVIVLLLQHLAITFAALSIVRERRSGAMELFRISPLSPLEILMGKYWSYMLFGAVLAAILTATVVFILKVPMFGSWGDYVAVILALLFASLGLGFLISLVSETDTQAVQYTMFFLLASVFFSGFFLDLRYLRESVRLISWGLPATYAIQSLQNVMLRGIAPHLIIVVSLSGMGLVLFLLSWWQLGRVMRRQ